MIKKLFSVLLFSSVIALHIYGIDLNTAKLLSALEINNKDYQLIENALMSNADLLYIDTAKGKPESIVYKLVEKIYIDSWEIKKNPDKYQKAVSLLKLYFKNGGKLQWVDSEILYPALHSRMPEVVEILLQNGASPTFWITSAIGKDFRNSPLQEAYAIRDDRLAKLLIAYGAKDISEHEKTQIAFIEAAADISCSIFDFIDYVQKKGANINEKNANNETALMKVIDIFLLYDKTQMYKFLYLLGNGADPNIKARCFWDDGYATPLHSAIYYTSFVLKDEPDNATCIMIIDSLLKAGAFVSATDRWEDTPLHTAAEHNNITGAKMLISAGCKVMAKGYQGKTPLDYATSGEMIRLLKENGATE